MTLERTGYTPTQAQLRLRKLIREKTRVLAYGGSRSGKTFEFCHALTVLALRYGGRYAVFRRYFNSVRNSVFDDTFPKMLELSFPGLAYKRNLSDAKIQLPCNGAEFWFVGLDDQRRVERILGREYASVYFNECSEIAYDSVEVAVTRLAQRRYDAKGQLLRNRAFFDCNPPGKSHWTYKLFIQGISPSTRKALENFEQYGAIQINPIDNQANLPCGYLENTLATGSERMKKRFLYGEFANDLEGALWKQEVIDQYRETMAPNDLERVVVAVDPAVTANCHSDATGIVVAGRKRLPNGVNQLYVLEDLSRVAPPEEWTAATVQAYHRWQADAVVAEVNQGGDLVVNALRQVDPFLPVKKVRATRGKILRAEPISILYQQGRVSHVGAFPALEEEMTSYAGVTTPNQTVDRLDALVWAMTDLTDYHGECSGGLIVF